MKLLDLRKLLLKIHEQKNFNANFSLEFECNIETEDPNPLVKVINYIINYLTPITSNAIEISLNQQMGIIVLNFSVFSEQIEFPEVSTQLNDVLKQYNATLKTKGQPGEYFQFLITFG